MTEEQKRFKLIGMVDCEFLDACRNFSDCPLLSEKELGTTQIPATTKSRDIGDLLQTAFEGMVTSSFPDCTEPTNPREGEPVRVYWHKSSFTRQQV